MVDAQFGELQIMKGNLIKTEQGWVVNYKNSIGWETLPLHPDDLWAVNHIPQNRELEFQIVDFSQKCKNCGETVERGKSCTKGCFMEPGNFIPTEKLEFAKITKWLFSSKP